MNGGAGDDILAGSSGDDLISAGAGSDILMDGAGTDTLYGGTGQDTFFLMVDGVDDEIMGEAKPAKALDAGSPFVATDSCNSSSQSLSAFQPSMARSMGENCSNSPSRDVTAEKTVVDAA